MTDNVATYTVYGADRFSSGSRGSWT